MEPTAPPNPSSPPTILAAEGPTPRATDQYHALFHAMDQGFCVIELQFDDSGEHVVDFRYQQLNPAFSQQSGIPEGALGKTARELMPDLEPFWFDTYGRVALTGESVRLEHCVPQVGRWFDVHAFRVGAAETRQVGVLFTDITTRKQTAAADAFRLQLADALAPLADPVAVQEAVTRLARQQFGADRCYYGEVEAGQVIIRRDAAADGLSSVAGTYLLADFVLLQAAIEAGRPFSVRDARQDASVDDSLRQLCVQLQVISYLGVPVVKNGQVGGVLYLVQSTPRDWTAAETTLAADVAERTWAAVERARAEQALGQSEEKYRSLFNSIDEGFAISELLYDAQGRPCDARLLETNASYDRITQTTGAAGRRVKEVFPTGESAWFEAYAQVVETGESCRFESYSAALDRWIEMYASRVGSPNSRYFATVFNDVTERKRHEHHAAFLDELSQALAVLDGPDEIVRAAGEHLGAYLGVGFLNVVDVALAAGDEPAEACFTVASAWEREGVPGPRGTYRAGDYLSPEFLRAAHAGEPIVIRNTDTDPRVNAEAYRALGMRAFVSVPVLNAQGAWPGLISVLTPSPRDWRPDEVNLLVEVAHRVSPRIERARAEAALRVSEAKYRTLFETMDQGFGVGEVLPAGPGRPADFRWLEVNPQVERLTGMPQTALLSGETMRVVMPQLEDSLYEQYERVASTGEAIRIEQYAQVLDRWFDVYVYPLDGPAHSRIALLFTNITARKRREADLMLLAEVNAELAELTDPDRTMQVLCEKIARHFGAGFCAFSPVDDAAGTVTVQYVWHQPDAPDPRGTYRLSDYHGPDVLHNMRAGRPEVVPDTTARPPDVVARFAALGIGSLVNLPLVRQDIWCCILSLTTRTPYAWCPDELALLDELTARIWNRLERTRAEAALRVSEAKYRTLFETMDQGFGVGEVLPAGPGRPVDFRWLEVNPQMERLTGMPQAALLSGETLRVVMPQLEDSWYERYERVALTGEAVRFEEHAQVLGRWFDVYAYALDLEGPVPHRVALLFTNITARKQAEVALRHVEERHRQELEQQVTARTQELRENRRLLQTVFDASPTAIVVMRLLRDVAEQAEDFEILIFNAFNQQVTGRDDLVGQRFTAMFPQTVPTGTLARLLAVATTGEPADFEQWYVGEGMQHWFRHIVVRLDGLLVLTSEVITARKQAEQERARTLRLLEQAEAVAGLGSWDYDLRTREFRWSEGMYRLFAVPTGQPIAPRVYLDFVVDEDLARAEEFVRCLTTGCADFEETLRLRVGEQVKTVRLKVVVLHDEAGQPVRVLGVDLDISQLQRLEADNLRLRLTQQRVLFEAVQAAQEQERKRMAESLHNGIGQTLYATKLRLDQLDAPLLATNAALVSARNEANRLLSEAIRQTRALSHELVPMALEKFGLAVSLQDIGHNMSTPQLRLRCQVQLDEDAGPLAPALQIALYRMAQELALNIVKHARGATAASLELETMPGWALLRAEDNGAGFAALPADSAGLGLRSIRDRVALLGGQLQTGTAPTGGAYVRIRIPIPEFPAS